ncbi:hypothetical protein N7532_009995 [Penicillium argentinense]|uniref:Uncharacterized protein n=1 Tax=Penicillium argentinense TaxID=1131581 RepID=A0A9W9EP20_9EURO|nr:uncharacterized protein N7532_009995 [Penicillium argentinense]KAJ5085224.1 hypothetical protein N7532_009995 [Penicillium argentinense]
MSRSAVGPHFLNDRLGLVVAPSQFRLQPPVEDGGSVRLFQAICQELGRSLEAVTPETLQNGLPQAAGTPENMHNWLNGWKVLSEPGSKGEGSFTAKILELETANNDLCRELDLMSTRFESSPDEGRKLRAKNCMLEREIEASMLAVRRKGEELARLSGVGQVMQVLQG